MSPGRRTRCPRPTTGHLRRDARGVQPAIPFADTNENAPPGPAFVLRVRGVGATCTFLYATPPPIWPQVVSYSLYRCDNNIRAAAVLGVVGAGGLGPMLSHHVGLFQTQTRETCTVLVGMIVRVARVDAQSCAARRIPGHKTARSPK